MPGFYDDYSFTCKSCVPHCINCRSSTDCFVTEEGYEYDQVTGVCYPVNSLSTGAKAGIAVGAVVGTIGIGIAAYVISAKLRKAK